MMEEKLNKKVTVLFQKVLIVKLMRYVSGLRDPSLTSFVGWFRTGLKKWKGKVELGSY
jgi:hypothetical protein